MASPESMAEACLRPRLLYACAASFLTIVYNTYRRAEVLENPIGFLARSFAALAIPIVHPLEDQWLSLLFFIDGVILAVEEVAAAVFPPSEIVFVAADELAFLAETLPEKADKMFDEMLLLIRNLPLVERPAAKLVGALNGVIPAAAASDDSASNERDIVVDIKCDEKSGDGAASEENEEGFKEENEEYGEVGIEKAKAAAEEDIREVEKTCNDVLSALEKMGMEVDDEQLLLRDPILSLFDDGWQAKTL